MNRIFKKNEIENLEPDTDEEMVQMMEKRERW